LTGFKHSIILAVYFALLAVYFALFCFMLGRVVAWLLHDATLAGSQIMIEVVVAFILLIASRRLTQDLSKKELKR
jgi:hypothetical protein